MSASGNELLSRIAGIADEPIVLALMRDFYAEEHLVFDELIAQRAVRELLAQPQLGFVILLEISGEVVGHATLTFGFSLEFHGRFALLDELYIIPAKRGGGLGRRGLEIATDLARAQGVSSLRLEVNHANARARSVYLKAGFQDDRRDLFTHWLR
ncbi:MAG: GNAT family N-acetyltransferase [Rariglobus sp.]